MWLLLLLEHVEEACSCWVRNGVLGDGEELWEDGDDIHDVYYTQYEHLPLVAVEIVLHRITASVCYCMSVGQPEGAIGY